LIATRLRAGQAYTLIVEFSENSEANDCEHFVLAVKTWDSQTICVSGSNLPDLSSFATSVRVGAEPQPSTLVLAKKAARAPLTLEGEGPADLTITLDYSDAFFRPELTFRVERAEASGEEEIDSVTDVMQDLAPTTMDYARKQSTTYFFTDLPAGKYQVKLRQRFKEQDCAAPLTITVQAKKAVSADLERASMNLFQSQAEEQESPRTASKLPLDLGTYKFGASLLFSGTVQLDELES